MARWAKSWQTPRRASSTCSIGVAHVGEAGIERELGVQLRRQSPHGLVERAPGRERRCGEGGERSATRRRAASRAGRPGPGGRRGSGGRRAAGPRPPRARRGRQGFLLGRPLDRHLARRGDREAVVGLFDAEDRHDVAEPVEVLGDVVGRGIGDDLAGIDPLAGRRARHEVGDRVTVGDGCAVPVLGPVADAVAPHAPPTTRTGPAWVNQVLTRESTSASRLPRASSTSWWRPRSGRPAPSRPPEPPPRARPSRARSGRRRRPARAGWSSSRRSGRNTRSSVMRSSWKAMARGLVSSPSSRSHSGVELDVAAVAAPVGDQALARGEQRLVDRCPRPRAGWPARPWPRSGPGAGALVRPDDRGRGSATLAPARRSPRTGRPWPSATARRRGATRPPGTGRPWRRRRSAPGGRRRASRRPARCWWTGTPGPSRPSGPGATGCPRAHPGGRRGPRPARGAGRPAPMPSGGADGSRRAPGRPTVSCSAGAPPLTARRPARERVSHAPPASSASSGDCSNCCTSASASRDVASARSVLRPTQNRASAARLGSEVRRSTWGTAAGRADHVAAGRARSPATTHTSLAVPRRCTRTGWSSRTTRPRPPGSTLQPASPEGDRVATTIVRTTTVPGTMASPRITGAVASSRRAWAT